jgi:IMP dehydrogenase
MATIREEVALTFEDVLIVPRYSEVRSRKNVDTGSEIASIPLKVPIISSNMDSITEYEMAKGMGVLGGMGILHRFAHDDQIVRWIQKLVIGKCPAVPSVGVGNLDLAKVESYIKAGAQAICIDIAHGHTKTVIDMIKAIKNNFSIKIIAGNIATKDGALALVDAGADVIKVGVGPGSLCTTRIQTGCGVPQLTAIMEVAKLKVNLNTNIKIIADGGIKHAGDITKALAAGADAVMIGSLFAGCTETPWINGKKVYRGMASREAQMDYKGAISNDLPEGVSKYVDNKGPVEQRVKELISGLRSGMSYCGASNISELQKVAEFVKISRSGWAESLPHGL